jgi:hypothetical protein
VWTLALDVPILISNVPRLNVEPGAPSAITLPSHDLATPALGVFDPEHRAGLWLLTQQRTRFGPYGLGLRESAGREAATFCVDAPCVREGTRSWATWSDRAPDWGCVGRESAAGLHHPSAPLPVQERGRIVRAFRPHPNGNGRWRSRFACAPFSACAPILERKFNDIKLVRGDEMLRHDASRS